MPGLITHSSGAWYQYWSAFFGVQILDQSFVVSVVLKAEKYYYSFLKFSFWSFIDFLMLKYYSGFLLKGFH